MQVKFFHLLLHKKMIKKRPNQRLQQKYSPFWNSCMKISLQTMYQYPLLILTLDSEVQLQVTDYHYSLRLST